MDAIEAEPERLECVVNVLAVLFALVHISDRMKPFFWHTCLQTDETSHMKPCISLISVGKYRLYINPIRQWSQPVHASVCRSNDGTTPVADDRWILEGCLSHAWTESDDACDVDVDVTDRRIDGLWHGG